ncbi:MAG TPA: helix-hairpin-helix domain-containing protein [Candidatus Nanoarchaeia archaeon]|nr:helix-hairpin-helix domain-containing protein [Candidatus Nanoarchaeia archaeon]
MDNLQVARILENIADLLELQNVPWKPRAYRNAARSVELLSEDIKLIWKKGRLIEIPGVGQNISAKIEEMLKLGYSKYYHQLKRQVKIDLESLKNIPELGPKRIKVLYEQLKIKNVQDLKKALAAGKVRQLPGFGEKIELTFRQGIEALQSQRRFSYSEAASVVKKIIGLFKNLPYVQKIDIAGSFRRKEDTVGDLDFLIVSENQELVMDTFTSMQGVISVPDKGKTKSSVKLKNGLQVDLRVVSKNQYGAALLYFTGNKQHNIELRKIALKKGWTLNEYALSDLKTKTVIAGWTEEEIYHKLGFQYIPPEERLNQVEFKKYRM